ncbi:MAG: SRPBCC domain-containing protein [Actinobacteria bacterium]|nr:SRPBCC domain-containing protein [Actinomycetota bacterium]
MVDVDGQIAAVRRELRTTGEGADAVREQRLTQEYRADIADVWEAVTTPDRIRRWFLPVTGDLRVGGSYQIEGNAGGRILECEPPDGDAAHYRLTWAYGDAPDTWVTLRLTALAPDRTRLDLAHQARVEDIPEELWRQFGPSATGIGWDSILLGLALFVGGARDGVAPAEAAAWMAGPEGRRFSQGSADAWAAAHVADGADADAAAMAAAATVALYTQPPPGVPEPPSDGA